MNERINPFHDLYLTEAIGPDSFVKLFSPKFITQGGPLFQPGNVILKGLQGSGKTMLLNLLKPEIRLAYQRNRIEFPVPREHRKFISAGINLRKSGVAEFSQLILPESTPQFIRELAMHFGDFINYWVIQDLLNTIEVFQAEADETKALEVGVNGNLNCLDDFSVRFSKADCWLGGIKKVEDFHSLKEQIRNRILQYRNYLNFNIDSLPDGIRSTKSVIGEPISVAADLLRLSGVLDEDVSVYIRIDQYEELPTLDFSGLSFGNLCQQLIHKALSSRSTRVSYRIGTRQYAWPDAPIIFATDGSLELKRDYSVISIDEKLRRSENRSTWLFPELVEDVFLRRLKLTDYEYDHRIKKLLTEVFGKTKTAVEKSALLVTTETSRRAIIQSEPDWPKGWTDFLKKLAVTDPFLTKLGEAWVRQKGKNKQSIIYAPPEERPFPWEKKYWKKERAEQALVQIASRNKQQLIWQGVDDVIGLSGGNILVFLFICQHIWDAWLRDIRGQLTKSGTKLPCISINTQSMGILNASEEWQKKPIEGKESKKRLQFIQNLGARYYNLLTNDKPMSYPGWNGFSISLGGLEGNPDISTFLNLSVDYGDLHEAHHTSKVKGEKRKKFYLAPILCPGYRIPYKHTKEPEYLTASALRDILYGITQSIIKKTNSEKVAKSQVSGQQELFE